MAIVERIINEARRLSPSDRVRLVEEVERSLEGEVQAVASGSGSYAPLIAMAGTVPSDFSDVSTDKYRHLAAASSAVPGDE